MSVNLSGMAFRITKSPGMKISGGFFLGVFSSSILKIESRYEKNKCKRTFTLSPEVKG
jgi:hypothetical protein